MVPLPFSELFLGGPSQGAGVALTVASAGACTKHHYSVHLLSTGLLGRGDSNSPVLSCRQEDPCELILLLGCPWDTESATSVHPTLATWQMKAKQVNPLPSLLLLPPLPLHSKPWLPSPTEGRSVCATGAQTVKYPQNIAAQPGSGAIPRLSPQRMQGVPQSWAGCSLTQEEGAGWLRSIFYCRLHSRWEKNNLSFLLYYGYNLRAFPDRILQVPAECYHRQNYKVKCNH